MLLFANFKLQTVRMEKYIILVVFFLIAFRSNSQTTSDTHRGVYSKEQVRQNRMQQNDDAHRNSMKTSNSNNSTNSNNSSTGISAGQHWENVKNSNKKVIYTQTQIDSIQNAKNLKKRNDEDRINANNRSEVERIQGYLNIADDTSLPSSERLEALDRYMSYFDMKYQRANAKPDHSHELLKKAYIYFNDEDYEKANGNFRIPRNSDEETKNKINSMKAYCDFLMYEERSVNKMETIYASQKDWSIPLAYSHYLNGNIEKSIAVLENHLKTISEIESEKTKNNIFLTALYLVNNESELALKRYNSNSKIQAKSKQELAKKVTDYLGSSCDDNINNYKFIRISTLFGMELQKRLLPNDKSIVEKSLKVNQKLKRQYEIEEDKNLLGDASFLTKKQRLELKKQEEINSKIAIEQLEKDTLIREADAILNRKNNQHPKYFNQVTEIQKVNGYKQYDNIVDLCNNLYKTKIIDLADQTLYTDELFGEKNDDVKGLKLYYKNSCLISHLRRYNVTDFSNGYLEGKSCAFSIDFENKKELELEYNQMIKDIKRSKKYKNKKIDHFITGHIDEVQFKSLENAIYSNTFINIEIYKSINNGKYALKVFIQIDE